MSECKQFSGASGSTWMCISLLASAFFSSHAVRVDDIISDAQQEESSGPKSRNGWKPPGSTCPYDLESDPWTWYFFTKHDSMLKIPRMGKVVIEDMNTCCKNVHLVPGTSCSKYRCQESEQPRKQLYTNPSEECARGAHAENSLNVHSLQLFSEPCPPLPICEEEKLKSGPFQQMSDREFINEAAYFTFSGRLVKIDYDLDRSMKWYQDYDGSSRGLACKFALRSYDGTKVRDIGRVKSGDPVFPSKAVSVGDQLVWWGCDIRPQGSEYEDQVLYTSNSKYIGTGLRFPSLVTTVRFADFKPEVKVAEYNPFMQQLTTWWSAVGNKIRVTREVACGEDCWRMDSNASADGSDVFNRMDHSFMDNKDYRLAFHTVNAAKGSLYRLYLRTKTPGCQTGYKCCAQGSGQRSSLECVKKNFFGKTCGSVPGRHGAKGAQQCYHCDGDRPFPKAMAKACPGCDLKKFCPT